MELVCAILFLALGTCAAAPQDLTGKMFTLPEESETSFVQMDLDLQQLSSFTFCMRVFTDLLRPHTLFQLTTNSYDPDNDFRINNDPRYTKYYASYNNSVYFNYNNYRVDVWHMLCCSWTAQSGIVQIWLNGEPSSRKFLSQAPMKGPLAVVIGKSTMPQSSRLVPSSARASPFCGMVSDLHMWDYVLSLSQIKNVNPFTNFLQGNVLSWRQLDFQTHGRVLLESK